jgi:hypothetical protein
MKKTLKKSFVILLLLVGTVSFSQTKTLDSLIQRIDNKDAYIVLLKTVSPRINSSAGTKIIEIGKPATPELIKALGSEQKGVIAHFILSEIWKDTWDETLCCQLQYQGITEIITVNNLKIYIEENQLYSKLEDLKAIKEKWTKLWES